MPERPVRELLKGITEEALPPDLPPTFALPGFRCGKDSPRSNFSLGSRPPSLVN
jgi:hypothetical protein